MTTSTETKGTLRSIREARGLSLRHVAREAKITPGHLSRIERGINQPSVAILQRVAKVLGLSELEGLLRPYVGDDSS